jgi:hypothetical protein
MDAQSRVEGPVKLSSPTTIFKMVAFRVVAPCTLVEVYRRFGAFCFLHNHNALTMKAANTTETPENFY